MAKLKDQYCSILNVDFSMAVIDTLEFFEINVGLNLFDKVGMKIQRIDYKPDAGVVQDIQQHTDQLQIAVCTSDDIDDLTMSNTEVIDNFLLDIVRTGTGDGSQLFFRPYTHDFSGLSGGGLLVAPKPLYVGANSSGLTVSGSGNVRLYFTMVPLSDADYLELLQLRRAFG